MSRLFSFARRSMNITMNMEMDKVPRQVLLGVADLNSDVHEDRHELQAGASGIGQRCLRHLQKYPRLRMFLSECRSFLCRTYIVLTSTDTHRVPTGPAYLEGQSGRVFRNIRSLACIRDIERISSNRPSTPLDWSAYRDAWEAGAEWASSILDSGTLDSEHKALLVSHRSSD